MKTRTWAFVFTIVATLCYLVFIVASIEAGKATGYRFFLYVTGGIIFFITIWRTYLSSKPNDQSKQIR